MKIPDHVTKPDARPKGRNKIFDSLAKFEQHTKKPFPRRSPGIPRTVSPATLSTGWREPTSARGSIASVRRGCCGSRWDSLPSWKGTSMKHARTRIQPRRPPGRRTSPRRNAGSATRSRRLWKSLPRKTSKHIYRPLGLGGRELAPGARLDIARRAMCLSPVCVFRPGGLNRSAVGKTQVSFTSRRPQQLAPSTLTSLLACTNALRRAILRHGYAWRQPRSDSSLRGRPALFPERAPCPSIQSTLKQKLCPSRLRPPRLHPQGRRGLS